MTITGGPVFWILLTLAVAAVVVFFERLMDLRRAQIDWQAFMNGVLNVLDTGNEEEALAICEDTPVPVANIVATAIRHGKGDGLSLRESVEAQCRAEIDRLDRRLFSLSIIGEIAPLLGLLGTLIGFIKAVAAANGQELVSRADLLSWAMEALVSAAVGLAIAIPVVVMYGCLRNRVDRVVSELEAAATAIIGHITARNKAKDVAKCEEN
jgi:biopolymer transport protein ExbB